MPAFARGRSAPGLARGHTNLWFDDIEPASAASLPLASFPWRFAGPDAAASRTARWRCLKSAPLSSYMLLCN